MAKHTYIIRKVVEAPSVKTAIQREKDAEILDVMRLTTKQQQSSAIGFGLPNGDEDYYED